MKTLLGFLILFFTRSIFAAEMCTLQLKVEGVIGPGVSDYIQRAVKHAEEEKCGSILLLLNTPGGNLQSTRLITEQILNSKVPFLCLVAPPGGHAGSAGAIILQACHVAGAMEATNIGAATPIAGSGEELGKDLRQKLLNDTISWLEGMTKLRGRNLEFSKKIVTEAKAVDAKEALKQGAIDTVVTKVDEFVKFAGTRTVKMPEGKDEKVIVGDIKFYNPDSRFKILQIFSDPQIAYLLFMGSLALLYFELTHPGVILPGVAGVIGLIISLVSFHTLDVQWGGLALMGLGVAFLIAEAFVPSFGALGIGGIVSFVLGGIFLFDQSATGLSLPLATIFITAGGLALIMLGFGYLALTARRARKQTGKEELLNRQGEVVRVSSDKKSGKLQVVGELWNFESDSEVSVSDKVLIKGVNGLKLKVTRSSK